MTRGDRRYPLPGRSSPCCGHGDDGRGFASAHHRCVVRFVAAKSSNLLCIVVEVFWFDSFFFMSGASGAERQVGMSPPEVRS